MLKKKKTKKNGINAILTGLFKKKKSLKIKNARNGRRTLNYFHISLYVWINKIDL